MILRMKIGGGHRINVGKFNIS